MAVKAGVILVPKGGGGGGTVTQNAACFVVCNTDDTRLQSIEELVLCSGISTKEMNPEVYSL